jgi:hypothetical protein
MIACDYCLRKGHGQEHCPTLDRDRRNMTYEIWGTYNGTIETLEQDLDLDEAQRLFYEYRMAFGNDWTIEVMEINKAWGTAQGVEW